MTQQENKSTMNVSEQVVKKNQKHRFVNTHNGWSKNERKGVNQKHYLTKHPRFMGQVVPTCMRTPSE